MRNRLLFCFCISLLAATAAWSQGRQITNQDLEKYREARLAAERDLRENYEKLGFPSPAELERRREKSRVENDELAAKLRADRLEQERLDTQRAATAPRAFIYSREIVRQNESYFPGGYYYTHTRPIVFPRQRGYVQGGYFAGGQFWPTGPRTPPQPLFVRPRN